MAFLLDTAGYMPAWDAGWVIGSKLLRNCYRHGERFDWAERDMVGAKAIGMRTVFARYGDTFGTGVSGADWDATDVLDVVRIVDEDNAAEASIAAAAVDAAALAAAAAATAASAAAQP